MIAWRKSNEGYCESKCGRFKISPLWCGRVKPQFYRLDDQQTGAKTTSCFTQREAKQTANKWLTATPPAAQEQTK